MNIQVTWKQMLPIYLLMGSLATIAAAEPYQVDTSIIGVAVRGRVIFAGPPREKEAMPVYRDSEFCGDAITHEALAVDPTTRGISGVVISLEGIEKGKPLAPSDKVLTLEIESKKCRFSPRIATRTVGSTLEIRNNDPILHNLHGRKDTRFGPTVFNVIQPAGTRSVTAQKPFREAGLVDVRCDLHPFMAAFVHIFEHPYFTITDGRGQFDMTQVPPGVYKLRVWHETLGSQEKQLKVPPGEGLNLDLDLGRAGPAAETKPAM